MKDHILTEIIIGDDQDYLFVVVQLFSAVLDVILTYIDIPVLVSFRSFCWHGIVW